MFEKFRVKKLSKIVQTVVTHFFEQITKKDYFSAFSKINFLNIVIKFVIQKLKS